MKSKFYKKPLTLLFILVAISSIIEVRALEWSEDFEDGLIDDWHLYGWDKVMGFHNIQIDPGFSVEDGVLKTPNHGIEAELECNISKANHETGIAYGSWAFDLLISSEAENFFMIDLMVSDDEYNFNLTGVGSSSINYTGYGLSFNHGDSVDEPEVIFLRGSKFTSIVQWEILGEYILTSDFTGTQHLDITRDTEGRFVVKLENKKIFDVTDTKVTEGQRFGITSWWGEVGIDNITINDEPLGIPGYKLEFITLITVPIVIGLIYIISKRRKTQS